MIVTKINPLNERYLVLVHGPNTAFCSAETCDEADRLVELVDSNPNLEILTSHLWVYKNVDFTIFAIKYETEDDFMLLKLSA